MDRRLFLGALAASAVMALTGGALMGDGFYTPPVIEPKSEGRPRFRPRPDPHASPVPKRFGAPHLTRVPLPGGGSLYGLPGDGNLLSLTVDDGNDSEVVALYAKFAADSGMRLTFFLNGIRPSWTDNAALLRPLVDSGQVQLGNHTWSHPSLTSLSDTDIVSQLTKNDNFIKTTYGVEAKPYYRPPFGYHNDHTDAVAAGIGYTQPVMWYGSLSDSGAITDQQMTGFVNKWLLPQHIVIGHANFATVTRHYDEIVQVIRDRGLQPITLDDVFLRR